MLNNFFPLLWSLKDRDYSLILERKVSYELSLCRRDLDNLTLKRLRSLISFARRNSKFYKKIFSERNITENDLQRIEDLSLFPCLTREDLRNNLSEVSGCKPAKRYVRSATGGTTSSPVAYYRDDFTSQRRRADTRVIDSWFGRFQGERVAFLWGAPQDFSVHTSLGMRIRNATYLKLLMLPSCPLDADVMEQHYLKLNEWQPLFLQAYPSALYEFCRFLSSTGRALPFLRGISVTAEPLHDYQRDFIESVLGARIFNWYGSRELGRVAAECEYHDGMHVNEPSVYVEVEPDAALPNGYGHLIITDLWNKATPFIRYRTGDIARVVEGACPCGRDLKRISNIEGRLVDTLVLPGGRKVPGVSLTGRIIKDFSEISELQIVQKTFDTFLLRVVPGASFSSQSLHGLEKRLKCLLDADIDVLFEEVAEIPRSASGKSRFVLSEVALERQ